MTVQVKKDDGLNLTKENFSEKIKQLEELLVPGTPVMFHTYHKTDIGIGKTYNNRLLFFSGGTLDSKGRFNVQKGKRNFCYVDLSELDPTCYRIVRQTDESLYNKLEPHRSWEQQHYNENTFSRAGPSTWMTFPSKGTTEILIGDLVEEKYPEAIKALKFARDAVYFELPYFYESICPVSSTDEERHTTRKIMRLNITANLLEEAHEEIRKKITKNCRNSLTIWETGEIRAAHTNRPLLKEDYIVLESLHPSRVLAYIKVKGCNGAYILPAKKFAKVVEYAFSKENIGKFYPYGLDD
jgi:hypothetical protein